MQTDSRETTLRELGLTQQQIDRVINSSVVFDSSALPLSPTGSTLEYPTRPTLDAIPPTKPTLSSPSKPTRDTPSKPTLSSPSKPTRDTLPPTEYNLIYETLLLLLNINHISPLFTLSNNRYIPCTPNKSHSSLLDNILPLALLHKQIASFQPFNLSSNAFKAQLDLLLDDFVLLITQLESKLISEKSFSLSMLNYYLLPSKSSLSAIASLSCKIYDQKSVLDPCCLAIISCGDPDLVKLFSKILQATIKPYLSILHNWIHTGKIIDPHSEFMIKQKNIKLPLVAPNSLRNWSLNLNATQDIEDRWWESRYTITNVPLFLEGCQDIVLLAGKYLNVVKECGFSVDIPIDDGDLIGMNDFVKFIDGGLFLKQVNLAYKASNQRLLDVLFKEYNLVDRLRYL